jgi:predicted nucleic acid-binding protein
MVLVDTSIWVDHLRRGEPALAELLQAGQVLMHPFVLGEIACGSLSGRASLLALLAQLPASPVAEADEVLAFIERHRLHGKGIGYVDVHLLAAALLSPGARLWTRDARLDAAAAPLKIAYRAGAGH